MNIFITGITGLVGTRLAQSLRSQGHTVTGLSRRGGPNLLAGDPTQPGPWLDSLKAADAIVHLAGENIFAKRWSAAFKQQIFDSRVISTKLIAQALAEQPLRADGTPKQFVSASAIGFYGDRGEEILTEESAAGTGFMTDVVQAWEAAADLARTSGVRVVHPRLGIVLDRNGGALPQMSLPYRLFVGGRVGNGKQYLSWIHHQDLTDLLTWLIRDSSITGVVNAVAPNPATNDEFGRALGRAVRRPHWLPVPGFALRLVLGEVAKLAVGGQRVLPRRAQSLGFSFRYPILAEALAEACAVPVAQA